MDDYFLDQNTHQRRGQHILVTHRELHWHIIIRETADHRSLDNRESLQWITTLRNQNQCISSRHIRVHRALVLCSWYLYIAKGEIMWWVLHTEAIKQIWEMIHRCTPHWQAHMEGGYICQQICIPQHTNERSSSITGDKQNYRRHG